MALHPATLESASSRLLEQKSLAEQFADICSSAEELAAAEDVTGLLDLALVARPLRHALARYSGDEETKLSPHDMDSVACALAAKHRALAGDALLRRFHEREIGDDETLLAHGVGVVSLVESFLPLTWNYDEDWIILFGNGFDAAVEVLRRLGQVRISVYVAPDEDAKYYDDDVAIVRSQEELNGVFSQWAPRYPKRVASRALRSALIDVDKQREVLEAAHLLIGRVRVDRNTADTFATTWLDQGIRNLSSLVRCPSVASFDGDFEGIPMIIVAPGPSLDKNISQISRFKGKAIVCTFSHTAAALAAAGIDPDFVLTVDSNGLQYHFDGVAVERIEAMINGLTVHPSLFEMPAKRHIAIGANAAFDVWFYQLFGEELLVPAGGSVATSAFALALKWKCDPIIVAGLDLSFSGGRYYTETSCDGNLKVVVSGDGETLHFDGWSDSCREMTARGGPVSPNAEQKFELDGYYGGKVPTSQMFWLFHHWFEEKIASVENGTRFLNCTEGGAYIQGMDHMSLSTAYDTYISSRASLSVGDILDKKIQKLEPSREEFAIQEVASTIESVKECLLLSRQCEALLAVVYDDSSRLDELAALEKQLICALRGARFMAVCKQKEIDLAFQRAAEAVTMQENLRASLALYAAVRDAADFVLPRLNKSFAEMNSVSDVSLSKLTSVPEHRYTSR